MNVSIRVLFIFIIVAWVRLLISVFDHTKAETGFNAYANGYSEAADSNRIDFSAGFWQKV